MKDIYYVNSLGERLDLLSDCFLLQTGTLFDHACDYTISRTRIKNINRTLMEKELVLTIQNGTGYTFEEAMDLFNDYTEKDISNGTPGKLYYGESYQPCFLFGTELFDWEYDAGYTDKNVKIITAHPSWIHEETRQFFPQSTPSTSGGLEFPFDFPFDFAESKTGFEQWNIDHYAPSHFKMIIYGPCENPRVLINGYPRQVFTSLEANEYLVIDSKDSTVIKHLTNGTTENVYNSRQFQPTIFEKIPSGFLSIDWSGTFGFDITLYIERSEPKW